MFDADRFRIQSLLWLMLAASAASAQLVQVPLMRHPVSAASNRTASPEALALPFWDDFSLIRERGFPNDTLWENSRSIWVNDGMGIDPPTVQVATFDGLDSLGSPYNITDILAKGFADKLTSRRIRLDAVPAGGRDSVHLSFFYQIKGRGEAPDPDDNLSLWFLDVNGAWIKVWEQSQSSSLDPARFYFVSVGMTDDTFFHAGFRFRFQNFARLSGPYDTWNIDYVYLNKGRKAADRSMPDRAISTRMTSPLGRYTCIPITHYRDTFETISVSPKVKLYGLLSNNFQPFRYTTRALVTQRVTGATLRNDILIDDDAVPLDPETGAVQVIPPFAQLELTLANGFPAGSIDAQADSAHVRLELGINTGDDSPLTYLPIYRPIDFLRNDSTSHEFTLHDFYAYDDGGAEFGAGLNQPGTELAYAFDLLRPAFDTLVAVDIHFPQFGDQSNQNLTLKIWADAGGQPGSVIHQQNITVTRTTSGRFTTYPLSLTIPVSGRYHVGWKQNSSAIIPAGLDKNFDSGDRIHFNINGTWEQNTTLAGSLMIRPVFGKGDGTVILGAGDREPTWLFPNPSEGRFRMPHGTQVLDIIDAQGRSVAFDLLTTDSGLDISMKIPLSGFYLLRSVRSGRAHTHRIIIR